MSVIDNKKNKIELHIHVDGAIRAETIWDIAKLRNISLTDDTLESYRKKVTVTSQGSLQGFLKCFDNFMYIVSGCRKAITRISYELCEDEARQGVMYFEGRLCPHLLANCDTILEWNQQPGDCSPQDVVEAVLEGFRLGEREFGIKARVILCCMFHRPEWSDEIINLCKKYKDCGVVGIDIAGDELVNFTHPQHIEAFQEAARCGIFRTVHAAEIGPAEHVKIAMEQYLTQRVGHGYGIVQNETIYNMVKESDIHIEVCPVSSMITQGARCTCYSSHPAKQFAKDGLNFSINSDDPGVMLASLEHNIKYVVNHMGLTESILPTITMNAARSAFLPEAEKNELIEQVKKAYQII